MGAINALSVTVRQITRFHVPPYGAEYGNLVNFEAFDHKWNRVCTKAMSITVLQITGFHVTPFGAEYGNFVNFEAFDHNGTVFAPNQCFYEKVAMGMENQKM